MKARATHRWFPGSFSTFCGMAARDVDCTRHDHQTTCRRCLRAMGAYERRRFSWRDTEHTAPPGAEGGQR